MTAARNSDNAKGRQRRKYRPTSNFVLTRDRFVRQVARALCLESGVDPDGPVSIIGDDQDSLVNWETFKPESRTAILAYLAMLEADGYRIIRPDRQSD